MFNNQVRTIGYLRVSTADQDLEKFKSEVEQKAETLTPKGIYQFVEEKVSGTKDWKKRDLWKALYTLGEGSNVIVPELSRLARSIRQVLEIVDFCREKKLNLFILKQGLNIEASKPLDMNVELQLNMIAMIAQYEKSILSMRTKEALKARKDQGVKLGRPKGFRVLSGKENEVKKYLDLGLNMTAMSKIFKVSPITMTKFVKELK